MSRGSPAANVGRPPPPRPRGPGAPGNDTASLLLLDLAFADPAAERAYRAHAAACNWHTDLAAEVVRLCCWAIIAARLVAAGDRPGMRQVAAGFACNTVLIVLRAIRCAAPLAPLLGWRQLHARLRASAPPLQACRRKHSRPNGRNHSLPPMRRAFPHAQAVPAGRGHSGSQPGPGRRAYLCGATPV